MSTGPTRKGRPGLSHHRVQGLGFRVQGLGFRVQGLGFRVQGLGFRGSVSGFRVEGSGFRVRFRGGRTSGTWLIGRAAITGSLLKLISL